MEKLFTNTTVLKKDLFLEAIEAFYKVLRIKYRIFTLVSFIIFTIYAVTYLIRLNLFGIFVLSASVFFLFMFFKAYLIRSNKTYQSIVSLNPSCRTEYTFYDGNFESVALESKRIYDYEAITHIVETKNSILLIIIEAYIIIEKSGFEEKKHKEFLSFIKGKCPKAHIRIK